MAITQNFSDMINEYLPEDLLKNEVIKNDWFLSKVEIKEGWNGGAMDVGFEEAAATSLAYGNLTSDTDIAQAVLVRGTVSGYKHISSSMIFNHRDLLEHASSMKISKKSFLNLLPSKLDSHIQHLRETVSLNLLNGKKLCNITADATALGVITVDRPERLKVGQKIEIHDSVPTTPASGYVRSVDLVAGTAVIYDARSGGAVVDLSAWDAANSPYVVNPGGNDSAFSGLTEMILPASAGGSATLYGKTKTAYTYLQSYAVDGSSSITSSEILKPIFDAYTNHRIRFSGDARKVVMSLSNMALAMKQVEASKGAYSVVPNSEKATVFFSEVTIRGVGGGILELVGVREMNDDVILGLDFSAFKFETQNFIKRIKDPEGKEYFTKRATTGYQFILDHELYGELVLTNPQKCWAIYGVSP
jgi:hypothetical protein